MSDYGERLKALRKAKYPDFSEDMDMHDITDGMSWMADRIEELEAKLAKAVKLIELAIELGRWELNPSFRDELIAFTAELTSSVAADNQVKGGKHD